jgi:hypothetical protein
MQCSPLGIKTPGGALCLDLRFGCKAGRSPSRIDSRPPQAFAHFLPIELRRQHPSQSDAGESEKSVATSIRHQPLDIKAMNKFLAKQHQRWTLSAITSSMKMME